MFKAESRTMALKLLLKKKKGETFPEEKIIDLWLLK